MRNILNIYSDKNITTDPCVCERRYKNDIFKILEDKLMITFTILVIDVCLSIQFANQQLHLWI